MKLTNESKTLMNFITKNKIHIPNSKSINKKCLHDLYNLFIDAFMYVDAIKKSTFYHVKVQKIEGSKSIPKPKTFPSSSFHPDIREYIDTHSVNYYEYTLVPMFNRSITICFIQMTNERIPNFDKYIQYLLVWLYIINRLSLPNCCRTLKIYFYMTGLKKQLPNGHKTILNEKHVNTAFTRTCNIDAEIVIFRKEEWFKVFIHETFHNFGLDFSGMNTDYATKCVLNIFKVDSEVNLYESYTECWAEIMNALFCSFLHSKDKNNIEEFLTLSEIYINFERSYSFLQLVKTLNFMGLDYSDLYSNNQRSKMLRDNLYKENTNVLAYYIIKTILINNYPSFLLWCKDNNFSLLQFKKTLANQKEFCKFIEKKYKTKSLLENISNTQDFLNKLNVNDKKYNYILSNLRMSICELG